MEFLSINISEELLSFLGLLFNIFCVGALLAALIASRKGAVTFHYHAATVAGILLLASILCGFVVSWILGAARFLVFLFMLLVVKSMRDSARSRVARLMEPAVRFGPPLRFWQVK